MPDYNERVSKAANAYKRSEDCRWFTCLAASRMNPAEMEELRTRLKFNDVRHIRNYAMAGLTYRTLRRIYGRDVQMLRKGLTIGHFYQIGYDMHAYEFSPREAVEQLRTSMEEGASKETMHRYIQMEHGALEPDYLKLLDRAIKALNRLAEYSPTSERTREVLLMMSTLDEWSK